MSGSNAVGLPFEQANIKLQFDLHLLAMELASVFGHHAGSKFEPTLWFLVGTNGATHQRNGFTWCVDKNIQEQE